MSLLEAERDKENRYCFWLEAESYTRSRNDSSCQVNPKLRACEDPHVKECLQCGRKPRCEGLDSQELALPKPASGGGGGLVGRSASGKSILADARDVLA